MFSLVLLSKSKFFTRAVIFSFLSHSCLFYVTLVALMLLMSHLCHTCFAHVALVPNVYRSCLTRVALVLHSYRTCIARVTLVSLVSGARVVK